MTRPARRYRWLYAAVALCSLVVNLPWLATISAWLDEAATRSAATRPLPYLWRLVHHQDAVSGFYYLILHGWTSAFGDSWFIMRLPSAAAVAAACVAAVACGRLVGGWPVAVTTGALMVLLPGVAWAGLDTRPTAFAMLLVTAALWWWLRSAPVPGPAVWVLLAVAGLIQLTGGLQVTALINRRSIRTWQFWCGATFLAAVLAPLAVIGHRQIGQVAWIHPDWLGQLLSALFGRPTDGPQSTRVLVAFSGVTNVLLMVLIAAAIGWVALTVRTLTVRSLLQWAYLPALLAVVIGLLTGSSQYVARYFASSVPAIILLVSIAVTRMVTRRRLAAAVGSLAVLCLPALVAQRVPDGKWGEDLQSVARVIHTSPSQVPVFYVGNAVSVGIAYPDQVREHRQTPDPSDAAISGQLWGATRTGGQIATALPPDDSLIVTPTNQAATANVALETRCQTTRTIPGKRFTVLFVRCTR